MAVLSAAEAKAVRLRSGAPVEIEMGGEVRERAFVYTPASSGTLYVRLRSEDAPLALRVRGAAGKLLEDAPKERKSSFLSLEVEKGEELAILVASNSGGESRATLEVFEAPETSATLSAAEAAGKALDEVQALEEARDLDAARKLLGEVLKALLSTPGAASSHAIVNRLQALEGLAYELQDVATYAGAWKAIFDFSERALPEDHPERQGACSNLALALRMTGDLRGARVLQEKALAVAIGIGPEDHEEVQRCRLHLAATLRFLGDLPGAKSLQEKALEALGRSLPDDAFDLQMARDNLAATLHVMGEARAARALQEKVLEVFSRTLESDDLNLQIARTSLALTLWTLGDYAAAKVLQENVLEILSRTLPEGHDDLQRARDNLAATYGALGDLDACRKLQEKALEITSRTRPDDHPELQRFRGNLAATLAKMGDLGAARPLMEKVCEVHARTLPPDHPDALFARSNLAMTLRAMGDVPAARELQQETLETLARVLPEDHRFVLRAAHGYAVSLAATGEKEACKRIVRRLARGLHAALDRAELALPPRELEALAADQEYLLSTVLSLVAGAGPMGPLEGLEDEAFAIVERARAVAAASFAVLRSGEGVEGFHAMREASRVASEEVSRLSRSRDTGPDRAVKILEAVRRREEAERRLRSRLAALPVGDAAPAPGFSAAAIAARLRPREAAVGFWRYRKFITLEADDEWCYLAFVLRKDRPLARIDLGSAERIDDAIASWLDAIEAPRGTRPAGGGREQAALAERKAGEELRGLVLDPLRGALGDAERAIVAPDGALHLVPLDALPEDDGFTGDRLELNVRASLKELTATAKTPLAEPSLLALGGIDYDAATDAGTAAVALRGAPAEALRSPAGKTRFAALPATGREVDRIAALYRRVFAESPALVLKKSDATFEALKRHAPKARFLHVATHGYFAPDSVPSVADAGPLDSRTGLRRVGTPITEVHGLAPMVLCGLALSGANADPGGEGVVTGVMTAEELSALDLRGCELAILSACETNAGCLRAGQGIASLQQALHTAGARSAVTSLWKVPDAATRKLMEEIYRRIWVLKEPKARALREAKRRLREERDAKGTPRHRLRDWAGWVLTGDPD
jgi:CHAT domain-containing protein